MGAFRYASVLWAIAIGYVLWGDAPNALAILGIAAGWARWLELRLPPEDRRIPALVWPVCFLLVGFLLLTYRES